MTFVHNVLSPDMPKIKPSIPNQCMNNSVENGKAPNIAFNYCHPFSDKVCVPDHHRPPYAHASHAGAYCTVLRMSSGSLEHHTQEQVRALLRNAQSPYDVQGRSLGQRELVDNQERDIRNDMRACRRYAYCSFSLALLDDRVYYILELPALFKSLITVAALEVCEAW